MGGASILSTSISNSKGDFDLYGHKTSGFHRWKNAIALGFCALTSVYVIVYYALQDSGDYLVPADEFCTHRYAANGRKSCSRPDLFAFQVSSGLALTYCAWIGAYSWYYSKRVHTNVPQTPEGRLYKYLEESEKLAAVSFTFQLWDFFISLLIPEHSTAIMLIHHILAAAVSWFAVNDQFLHYYGIYFLGIVEVSSIFLLFVDLAKYFPPHPDSLLEKSLKAVIGPAFVITFFVYRVIVWWKVSFQLWSDALHVLRTGKSHKYRNGKSYVLYVYLISNVLLGILQLYWLSLIIVEVKRVFFNGS